MGVTLAVFTCLANPRPQNEEVAPLIQELGTDLLTILQASPLQSWNTLVRGGVNLPRFIRVLSSGLIGCYFGDDDSILDQLLRTIRQATSQLLMRLGLNGCPHYNRFSVVDSRVSIGHKTSVNIFHCFLCVSDEWYHLITSSYNSKYTIKQGPCLNLPATLDKYDVSKQSSSQQKFFL